MAKKIISTLQLEVYDSDNVRIGYMKKNPDIAYVKARYDIDYIDAAEQGPPIVPVVKDLNLIGPNIEYFALNSSLPVKISVNESTDLILVDGQFVIAGSEITSISITNENDSEVVLEIVQGDETVSGN